MSEALETLAGAVELQCRSECRRLGLTDDFVVSMGRIGLSALRLSQIAYGLHPHCADTIQRIVAKANLAVLQEIHGHVPVGKSQDDLKDH